LCWPWHSLKRKIQRTAAQATSFNKLTAQLQTSPDDEALRGKIISLALTLNPKPTTPDAVTMAAQLHAGRCRHSR
jgi:hypothetical protein